MKKVAECWEEAFMNMFAPKLFIHWHLIFELLLPLKIELNQKIDVFPQQC
jgi:hypothetical protein